MKLLFNPFKNKKRRDNSPIWNRLNNLGNFTWKNKEMIDKLQNTVIDQINHVDELFSMMDKLSHTVNELSLIIENLSKPKKRGRPKKNAN
tara:strand:+ start:614 stop:883 length:270 start_codon:yes stop_codon:yes gene_type:complete